MIHVVFIAFSSFLYLLYLGWAGECELWAELRLFLHHMHLPFGFL